ncbi:MAG: PIN domain-containing protein [Vulcanimicrobiaceae bacterium]
MLLDSEALSKIDERDLHVLAWLKVARDDGVLIQIPAPVFAETLTGRPRNDTVLYQELDLETMCINTPFSIAKRAGELRFRAGGGRSLAVDALIVASAESVGADLVLTGDPRDLNKISAHARGVVCKDYRLRPGRRQPKKAR